MPIAIVLPNETIIYVDENFKSSYRSMFTLEGVNMKVTSFQMTPICLLLCERLLQKRK